MQELMGLAREAARSLRRNYPQFAEVGVFDRENPYLVAYTADRGKTPWTAFEYRSFPVFIHKAGSIPPLKP
jgi:hypothetical protein